MEKNTAIEENAAESVTEEIRRTRNEWRRFFTSKWVVDNIPFFLFLCGLAIFYIYNGHHADKLIRSISVSEKNIKELEYEYKSLQSEVIFRSKASELVKAVEPLGLKEITKPPYIIGINTMKEDSIKNSKDK